ncbi:MAG: metal ABC transporter permease, partial [Eggerthellaceae bacterium]|nr:metal ABC transporter permease [Eggerthellaceae bacterium]
ISVVGGVSHNLLIVTPLTLRAAFFILRRGHNHDVKGDALLAMSSAAALAIGYLIMNIFGASSNITGDIHEILFGSTALLTLSNFDVIISIALALGVVITFILLYNRIFSLTFDENFAQVSGLSIKRINIILAAMISLVIVSGMSLIGALLMSALIVFPAMTALKLKDTFKGVTIASSIISLTTMLVGIILSIALSTPVGATVVVIDLVMFLIATAIRAFRK